MRFTILAAAAGLALSLSGVAHADDYDQMFDKFHSEMNGITNRMEQEYQLDALRYDMQKERARQDYLMDVERQKMRNELDHIRSQMEIDKSSAEILRLERGW